MERRARIIKRKTCLLTLSGFLAIVVPSIAQARDGAHVAGPYNGSLAKPVQAAALELRIHLPEGRGLARQLIDLGVAHADAAEVAKLAAGHLGDGDGGCIADIAVTTNLEAGTVSVARITLHTKAARTIIAQTGDEIEIIDESEAVVTLARIA